MKDITSSSADYFKNSDFLPGQHYFKKQNQIFKPYNLAHTNPNFKKNLHKKATSLRKEPTNAEKKLWFYLKEKSFMGLQFYRQYVLGKYIVDFICLDKMLVIEVDGQHHQFQHQSSQDILRTNVIEALGYKVIRFWNHDIYRDIQAVIDTIFLALEDR